MAWASTNGKSAVRSSNPALPSIAHQDGVLAEQDQVEIVVVVVVDPDGAFEAALRERGVDGSEAAFRVAIELRTGLGEDAEVHEAVVIEIARGDGDHAGDLFQAGIPGQYGAIAVQMDARCRPDQQIGAASAGGIDGDHAVASAKTRSVEDGLRIAKSLGRNARGIVDFGVNAPVDIFGDGSVFGLLLPGLETRECLAASSGRADWR